MRTLAHCKFKVHTFPFVQWQDNIQCVVLPIYICSAVCKRDFVSYVGSKVIEQFARTRGEPWDLACVYHRPLFNARI